MQYLLLKSKIHRCRVTTTALNYEGSITIDEELMAAARLFPNEKVAIYNISNGERFETYVIPGQAGSRVICLNGAAARLAQPNDLIIIVSYALVTEEELPTFQPRIIQLDENNNFRATKTR